MLLCRHFLMRHNKIMEPDALEYPVLSWREKQMIKNWSQLKKSLKTGTRFQITAHCRTECVGQIREITVSNTQGFYSIVIGDGALERSNQSNGGKGPVLWWSKAPFWDFKCGICGIYNSDTNRTEDCLIMAFRVFGEEEA